MQYIKKDNTIYRIEDIGTPLLIATEKIDEMTKEPVMETKENPVYVIKETYKTEEFVKNLEHDLAQATAKKDEAIKQHDDLVAKITEIQKDMPEIKII